jgi:glutaconate CoA-transferase subunit B
MVLKTIHTGCGITLKKVKEETGWELKVSDHLQDTLPPEAAELRVLREKVDPNHRWSGGKHAPVTPD